MGSSLAQKNTNDKMELTRLRTSTCSWVSCVGLTLWLLVAVVEDYIRSVVDACGKILHCTFAKLVHPEDNVIDIGDTIYVVLKNVYAERMEQIWTTSRRNQLKKKKEDKTMHKRYVLCGNNSTVFDARYRNDRIRTVQTDTADH